MKISVLGSTGVIGSLVLEIAEKEKIEVIGLSAGRNIKKLRKQVKKFSPQYISVKRKEDAEKIGKNILWGKEGLKTLATLKKADLIVIAVSGTAGILPTYEAVRAGKRIALANKESLVSAGAIIMEEARKNGAEIIPIDSEHNSLFQLFFYPERPEKVIITASGGPFLKGKPEKIRIEDVLSHPVWHMGQKITVDSATLMNKAFEIVEARWLFSLEPERISVLIHPQSIVHSIFKMKDGALIAHMSYPDMRIPIQYVLLYPKRGEPPSMTLDLTQVRKLEFYAASPEKFPALGIGYKMVSSPSSLSALINGANDEAVEAFLKKKLDFEGIIDVIINVSNKHRFYEPASIEEVYQLVNEGRQRAEKIIEGGK